MSHILLVEPDKPLAKTYSDALSNAKHKVSRATNSQAAINSADKKTPDVVILELQLAGHSGIEFLYEFRSYTDWQGVPVIVHTNVPYRELEDGWSLLTEQLGVSIYRYKPTTKLEVLVSSVSDLIKT